MICFAIFYIFFRDKSHHWWPSRTPRGVPLVSQAIVSAVDEAEAPVAFLSFVLFLFFLFSFFVLFLRYMVFSSKGLEQCWRPHHLLPQSFDFFILSIIWIVYNTYWLCLLNYVLFIPCEKTKWVQFCNFLRDTPLIKNYQ